MNVRRRGRSLPHFASSVASSPAACSPGTLFSPRAAACLRLSGPKLTLSKGGGRNRLATAAAMLGVGRSFSRESFQFGWTAHIMPRVPRLNSRTPARPLRGPQRITVRTRDAGSVRPRRDMQIWVRQAFVRSPQCCRPVPQCSVRNPGERFGPAAAKAPCRAVADAPIRPWPPRWR